MRTFKKVLKKLVKITNQVSRTNLIQKIIKINIEAFHCSRKR